VSEPIISVEHLGKRYRIQHQAQRQRYTALRDALADGTKSAVRMPISAFSLSVCALNHQLPNHQPLSPSDYQPSTPQPSTNLSLSAFVLWFPLSQFLLFRELLSLAREVIPYFTGQLLIG
jgi:hypothetical protein